jgi:anti-sigma regulatory factor (Ser/Thr protein kinase)
MWSRLEYEGSTPEVVLPADADVRAYMVDVGLGAVLGVLAGEGGHNQMGPPLIPLRHIATSHAWDDLINQVGPMVHLAVPDYEDANRMLYIMSELIDNATTHGHSPIGTYVSAQRYTGATSGDEPGIWVGIADAGVGIPRHLRGNPQYAQIRSDAKLIQLARQPWVTGTADARGWGLFEVFEKATASGPSDLLIRSGRGEGQFRVREGTHTYARYRRLRQRILGAWVHVRIAA